MSLWHTSRTVLLAAVVVLLGTTGVPAQQGGTTGQQGGAIGGLSGGNAGSDPGFSLSSRFQSNFSQFTSGSQSAGQTTAGASAANNGMFGQTTGGQNRNNFGGLGSLGAMGGLGALGGMGGFGFGNRNGMGGANQQQGNTAQKQIRTRMRLGFEPPSIAPVVLSNSATKIVNRVLSRSDEVKTSVTVKVQQGTAILIGIVESDHERNLAERLVMLEPGIEAVRNELIVGPVSPKPESLPTPSRVD